MNARTALSIVAIALATLCARSVSAQPIDIAYDDALMCHDPGLRSKAKYDGCDKAVIDQACANIRTLATVPSNSCARGALRLARMCTEVRAGSSARTVCDDAAAGNKQTGDDHALLISAGSTAMGWSGSTSGLSLPWATIATDFLVARAKGELVLFLKERVVGELCTSPDQTVVNRVFPESCTLLQAGGAGDADALLALPDAFRNDLRGIPRVLPGLIIELAITELAKDTNALKVVCMAEALSQGYQPLRDSGPIDALAAIANHTSPATCQPHTGQLLTLAGTAHKFVSGALETIEAARRGTFDIEALFAAFQDRNPPGVDLAWLKQNLSLAKRLITLVMRLNEGTKTDPALVDDIADATVDLFASIGGSKAGTVESDVRAFARAISAFATRRYAAGVLRLLAVPALDAWASSNATFKTWWAGVARFGPLVATLAQAENPEDAQRALEAAAAPLGSWREFRRDGWAGFVSAHFGFGGGYEHLFGADGGGVLTPTMPVGFELGRPLGDSWSLNLMISIVDLGALAAVRLNGNSGEMGEDNEATTTPATDFTSVFAPGASIGVGLGDSPFVLSASFQYLPLSREAFRCPTAQCADTEPEPALRAFVYFGVDLPAFPLFQ